MSGPEPSAEDAAATPEKDPLLDPTAILCHYTRADTAFEHILPTGKLRMGSYASMRDPFENQHHHFWVPNGIQSAEDNALWRRVLGLAGWIRSRKRLLSLTQGDFRSGTERDLPFRCPWARARLWEQYADDHHGVCLVFDRAEMLAAIREDLRDREVWEGSVRYTLAGFGESDGAKLNLSEFEPSRLQADVERHISRHRRDFYFLKTEEWASEFEYRVVLADDPGTEHFEAPPHFVSYGGSLRAVLVNFDRFPHWHMSGALRVARRAGAELQPMTWGAGRPFPGRWANPG